jgi:hypothetical protein
MHPLLIRQLLDFLLTAYLNYKSGALVLILLKAS